MNNVLISRYGRNIGNQPGTTAKYGYHLTVS
jgi:hypothetical protein